MPHHTAHIILHVKLQIKDTDYLMHLKLQDTDYLMGDVHHDLISPMIGISHHLITGAGSSSVIRQTINHPPNTSFKDRALIAPCPTHDHGTLSHILICVS